MKAKIIIEKLDARRFGIFIKNGTAEWYCFYSTDQSSKEAAFKETINVGMSIRYALQALQAEVEDSFYFTDVYYAAEYFDTAVKHLKEFVRE